MLKVEKLRGPIAFIKPGPGPGPGIPLVARRWGQWGGGRVGWQPKVEINFLGPKLRAYRSFLGSTLGLTGACP